MSDSASDWSAFDISSNDSIKTAPKSPTGAMVRSLLFPGLGQLYNNKKLKAALIFFAETGLLANSIYLNQKVVRSQTDWEKNFYINNRNLSVWWLVGTILFSVADAYVDAHLSDFDESPIVKSIHIEPVATNEQLAVRLRFCHWF
ncbi:MAG: DUF5683 domain-containing protein [bacterium]|nr:DUF5683 domain-containing protein [bacterium]